MATSAERQAKLREARAHQGIIPITAWVPSSRANDIREICSILCDHPDLTAALLTHVKTGKIVSKKKVVKSDMQVPPSPTPAGD